MRMHIPTNHKLVHMNTKPKYWSHTCHYHAWQKWQTSFPKPRHQAISGFWKCPCSVHLNMENTWGKGDETNQQVVLPMHANDCEARKNHLELTFSMFTTLDRLTGNWMAAPTINMWIPEKSYRRPCQKWPLDSTSSWHVSSLTAPDMSTIVTPLSRLKKRASPLVWHNSAGSLLRKESWLLFQIVGICIMQKYSFSPTLQWLLCLRNIPHHAYLHPPHIYYCFQAPRYGAIILSFTREATACASTATATLTVGRLDHAFVPCHLHIKAILQDDVV